MANKKLWLAILAMALVFGMTLIACANGTTSGGGVNSRFNGTWYSYGNVNKYYFNNGNYEHTYNGNPYRKGTYTSTSDSITMEITSIGSYNMQSYTFIRPSTWYTKDDFRTEYFNHYRDTYKAQILQTYYTYVAAYGVETANTYFQAAYGTSDIDSIADSYVIRTYGNTVETVINQYYTTTTAAYSLSGKTLILGGISLTKE